MKQGVLKGDWVEQQYPFAAFCLHQLGMPLGLLSSGRIAGKELYSILLIVAMRLLASRCAAFEFVATESQVLFVDPVCSPSRVE